MSFLKLSSGQFIETLELNRLVEFLDKDGFRSLLLRQTEQFGLLQLDRFTNADGDFLNFKVEPTALAGAVRIAEGAAVDSDGLLIRWQARDNITVPADGNWYNVKVSHIFTPIEQGTVNLSEDGTINGVGTDFLKVLRGMPNFPVKVRFYQRFVDDVVAGSVRTITPGAFRISPVNFLDVEIGQVVNNTVAVAAQSLVPETNLFYSVVGTFDTETAPAESAKEVYQYDSCLLVLTNGNDLLAGKEFIVARVRNVGGVVEVEDRRSQFYRTRAEAVQLALDRTPIPNLGVESVKFDVNIGTKLQNLVTLGWGFRAQSWTLNPSARTIEVNVGAGGRYEVTDDFTDGDFDGWRIYSSLGYSRILTSRKIGTAIRLRLDVLVPGLFPTSEVLRIVPDAQQIEFRFTAQNGDALSDYRVEYEVEQASAVYPLALNRSNEVNTYNVQYRLKRLAEIGPWFIAPEGTVNSHPTRYFNETAFDEFGVPLLPVQTSFRTTYTLASGLRITPSLDNYRLVLRRIDTGDLTSTGAFVLNQTAADAPDPLLFQLLPGATPSYQRFLLDGGVTLNKNLIVALRDNTSTRDGNFFVLEVNFGGGVIDFDQYDIQIREDYVSPAVQGNLRFSFRDFYNRLVAADIGGNDIEQLQVSIFFRRLGDGIGGTYAMFWTMNPDYILDQLAELGGGYVTQSAFDSTVQALGVRIDRTTYLGTVNGPSDAFKAAWNRGPGQVWINGGNVGGITDSPAVLLGIVATDADQWLVTNLGPASRLPGEIDVNNPGTAVPNPGGFDGFGYQIAYSIFNVQSVPFVRWVRQYNSPQSPNGQSNVGPSGFGPWVRMTSYNEVLALVNAEAAARAAAIAQEVTNRNNAINAAVGAEAALREAADISLQNQLNSEASVRAAADASLQQQINNINGNAFFFGGGSLPVNRSLIVNSVNLTANLLTTGFMIGSALQVGRVLWLTGQYGITVNTAFNIVVNDGVTLALFFPTLLLGYSSTAAGQQLGNGVVRITGGTVNNDLPVLLTGSVNSGLGLSIETTASRNITLGAGTGFFSINFSLMLLLDL